MNSLEALFRPTSVAVVGASEKITKIRGRLLKLLIDGGFAGRIYPVNPSSPEIQGLAAYSDVAALPEAVDLALIAVPAEQVMIVLEACAAKGVRSAAIFSAGSGLEAMGDRLQDKVAAFSARTGVRVLGPNAEGFIDTVGGVIATFSPTMQTHPPIGPASARQGYVSIVSQSGAMAFGLYSRACTAALPVRYLVSTGNEADIECAEVIDYLVDEGSSKAILLFLEGLQNPRRFAEAARKAALAGIPVIVAKVGKSLAGQRAAISHTAHLAGSDEAYVAAFSRYGVIRADDPEEMIALASLASVGMAPVGDRVAIITTSGGAGGWAADICEQAGLQVPPLNPGFRARLQAIVPNYGSAENPVDVTASVVEDGGAMLTGILKEVVRTDGIDIGLVIVSLVTSERLVQVEAMLETVMADSARPMLFHSPGTPASGASRMLMASGSALLNLSVLAKALRKIVDYGVFRRKLAQQAAAGPGSRRAGPFSAAMLADPSRLLDAYGIARPAQCVVSSPEAAREAAQRLGYPVALKIVSDKVPHKTEAGAVALGVHTDDAAMQAYDRIVSNARRYAGDMSMSTVLVQKMMPPGRELMIGAMMDPDFGPMIMLGFGGIYAEVLSDTVFALAPLAPDDARAMIEGLRGSHLLRGVRGEAGSDVDALADMLVSVSHLMADAHGAVLELDFNPVIVYEKGRGVAVVDSLIVAA